VRTLIVTGSSGLVGSAVAEFFHGAGFAVHGIDNNQRALFFGPQGDTRGNQRRLEALLPRFCHHELDIRDRAGVLALVEQVRPSGIVHAAAQPSHDRATAIPFEDFDTNATGTLNLLEAARRFCPQAPFVYLSSNKVYGDRPNTLALQELPTRWDFADPAVAGGIPECFPVDQSLHSLFGVSKLSGDLLVQEYGRYFQMPTCSLRCGCLTGPHHAGVELHGFLSHLVRCNVEGREYTVYGYKGKQVRDNLHAEDVARFVYAFYRNPRCGEVYNLGGGKDNSCSILEAFALTAAVTGRPQRTRYLDQNRVGDHICYYSNLTKIKAHYPEWAIAKSLPLIVEEIVAAWKDRPGA
jgi:CDP-paratose 2-epimerase